MSGGKFVVIKLRELIKTAVFAILGVIILVGFIWFFLNLGKEDSASYKDGSYYTQVVVGEESAMVCVAVERGMVADISLSEMSESAMVFYPLLETAVEEVCAEVVKNQSLDIQVSEQNAYSAQTILKGVAQALEDAK